MLDNYSQIEDKERVNYFGRGLEVLGGSLAKSSIGSVAGSELGQLTQIFHSKYATQQTSELNEAALPTLAKIENSSLLGLFLEHFSVPPPRDHILNNFVLDLPQRAENTQRNYLTDISDALVVKFFHYWDFPVEFNPIAQTLALMHALQRADVMIEQGKINADQAKEILKSALSLGQTLLVENNDKQLSQTTPGRELLEELLGPAFSVKSEDDRLELRLRPTPKAQCFEDFAKIGKSDRSMLNLLCSHFNSLMSSVDFWQQIFIHNKLMELYNFWKQRGNSENTIGRKFSSLLVFERHLKTIGLLKYSVVADITRPRLRPTAQITLTAVESKKLLDTSWRYARLAARKHNLADAYFDFRNCVMLHLLDLTAVRATALSTIRLKDINLDSATVVVKEKGRKTLTLPLTRAVVDLVIEYLPIRAAYLTVHPAKPGQQDYLFVTKRGLAMNSRSLSRIIDELAEQAGLKKNRLMGVTIGAHSIRRSVATQMRNNRAPIDDIKDMLGHVHASTTEIYTRAATLDNSRTQVRYHPRVKGKKNPFTDH